MSQVVIDHLGPAQEDQVKVKPPKIEFQYHLNLTLIFKLFKMFYCSNCSPFIEKTICEGANDGDGNCEGVLEDDADVQENEDEPRVNRRGFEADGSGLGIATSTTAMDQVI